MFFENFTARKSTIKNENNKLIEKIENLRVHTILQQQNKLI